MALEAIGSIPTTHPTFFIPIFKKFNTLGCRQAVRHSTLTAALVGSNPATPANKKTLPIGCVFLFVRGLRGGLFSSKQSEMRDSIAELRSRQHVYFADRSERLPAK